MALEDNSGASGNDLQEGMHKTAKNDAFNSQISQYMFWGATTLMGLAIGAPFLADGTLTSIAGSLGIGSTALLAGMGTASAAGLAGSIYFSEKAATSREDNDLMYSKVQAGDIAHAISEERAATPTVVAVPVPMMGARNDGKSWVQATGAQPRAGAQNPQWADYVSAQQSQQNEINL